MTSYATEAQAAAAADEILADLIKRTSRWDKALVEQAIRAVAADGREFSANDIRELLPDTAHGAIGLTFLSMVNRKPAALRWVGEVPSTAASTHRKRIGKYVLMPAQQPDEQVAA